MLEFTVDGIPQPQGSKTRTNYGLREDNRNLQPWRQAIIAEARRAMADTKAPAVCPECRVGKHDNCDGRAWDSDFDIPTGWLACTCAASGHDPRAAPASWPALGPICVDVQFCFSRPRSHYGTGRNAAQVRPAAPSGAHAQKPDLDKLLRALGDSLTQAGVIRDDTQITRLDAGKFWSDHAYMHVEIWGTDL